MVEVVLVATRSESLLRRRARDAGLCWSQVSRPLPDQTAVRATAYHLLASMADDEAADWLRTLPGARPGVRTCDPLTELRDRLGRLHQSA